MTIEEQMYDEIMHKMPHRIAELVRAIDTVHKMLEDRGYRKLSDNLDQLKKTLAQTEQEYNNFYNSLYNNKDFEALLPDTTEAIKDWLKNDVIDYPNTSVSGMQGMLNYNDRITDRNQLTTYNDYDLISFRDNEFKECKWLDDFEQSEEFKTLCEYYYNEEYDPKESGTFEDNYIKGNGDFDFKKFESETNFTQDIADPYFEQMINDPDINEKIEQTNEKIYNAFDERMKAQTQEKVKPSERKYHPFDTWHDDNFHILYTNGDGNHINENKYVNGGPVGTLDVKALNLKAGTPKEKLEQIAKNIIASTKAKDPIIKPEPIKQNNDFER